MYYIKELEGNKAHIHIKTISQRHVRIKNIDGWGWLRETVLSIKQTEDLFNAKFRWVTNDDKTKTRVFL
jgi:hypothetical protein